MDLFQIDDQGQLFISPDVDDWRPIEEQKITVICDLDDDLDIGVPEVPDQILYIYFPARFTKRGKRAENTFTNLHAVCTQL